MVKLGERLVWRGRFVQKGAKDSERPLRLFRKNKAGGTPHAVASS